MIPLWRRRCGRCSRGAGARFFIGRPCVAQRVSRCRTRRRGGCPPHLFEARQLPRAPRARSRRCARRLRGRVHSRDTRAAQPSIRNRKNLLLAMYPMIPHMFLTPDRDASLLLFLPFDQPSLLTCLPRAMPSPPAGVFDDRRSPARRTPLADADGATSCESLR